MSDDTKRDTSRRQFLANTGRITGASALAGVALPHVHAAGNDTIQLALIGCGGRGTGAADNALTVKGVPTKLVAMADVFPAKMAASYDKLKTKYADRIDVPEGRRFLGFDAYQQALDCLKPGDVAILGTPPAFRWVQFSRAIDKGLHTFMEKPVTVDGPTTRRMFQLGERASQKNLKVGVGLMIRHCRARQELLDRVRSGQIGDIIAMRAYRMSNASGYVGPKPANTSELMYQIQKFHSFLWASGGVFSDYYIHQIDECSWIKGSWPVEAAALGGRHFRGDNVDQNLDTYSVEYTYPDGTKLYYYGRNMTGCHPEFASYAHGAKGSAVISTSSHTPGRTRIYKGQTIPRVVGRAPIPEDPNLVWSYPQPEHSPYDFEWEDLLDAIRQDKPYNEVKRGAEASLVASMGRMAAHTGQIVTFDQMLNCDHEFAPNVDKLTMDGPAPLVAGPDGKYPVTARALALPGGQEREDLAAVVDLLVVLGGDGTLLAAARAVAGRNIPLLAVNLGGLGFLMTTGPHELYETLECVLRGEFHAQCRPMLCGQLLRGQEVVASYNALNDVVINKAAMARVIDLDAYVDEEFVCSYRADGLIVSTPTGSTAYSLSAGGPVIFPSVAALCITPICPHTLTNRPVLLPGTAHVEVVMKGEDESSYLTVDGQVGLALRSHDRIRCFYSPHHVSLIQPQRLRFFDVLRNKMKWGER